MELKQHLRETGNLALPLIITQVGNVVTGIVDNIFLGHIGKTELAAGGMSNSIFVLLLVFSIGISYATTPLTSTAHINDNPEEKGALLKNSLYLNLGIGIILFLLLYLASPLLFYLGQSEDVTRMAIPFFNVLIFSIIPISLFFVMKQYTEGLSNTKMAMVISIGGNLLNIVLNYLLINGYCGLPKMGYMGSCWATFIARALMAIVFWILLFKHPYLKTIVPFFKKAKLSTQHIYSLFKIGIGSALQFTFEVAAFALSSLIIGWYGKEQMDAHFIAISLAAFTYMFNSGLSGAACIRISNYKAKKDITGLRLAGKAAFALALFITSLSAILFYLFNQTLPLLFNDDVEIIRITADLLIIAALFQLFDGTQVVAQGMLRGLEDVKIPTVITLFAYWVLALPLAYYWGKTLNLQVYGVWYALTLSLVVAAFGLFWRYKQLTKKTSRENARIEQV